MFTFLEEDEYGNLIEEETPHILDMIKEMQEEHRKNNIPTGIEQIDNVIDGFDKEDLILISSDRSGQGKAILAYQNFALEALKNGKNVLSISFKLSLASQLARFHCRLTDTNHLESKKLCNSVLFKEIEEKYSGKLLFPKMDYDLSLNNIKLMIKKNKSKHKIDLLVIDTIDYLNDRKEDDLATICKKIKSLARELGITIIVTSPKITEEMLYYCNYIFNISIKSKNYDYQNKPVILEVERSSSLKPRLPEQIYLKTKFDRINFEEEKIRYE